MCVATNRVEKMYCKICRKYASVGPFVTGATCFRLDSLKSHNESKDHIRFSEIEKANTASPGTTIAEKCLVKMNKDVWERLSALFRISHALAKNGRPFSDFKWQCKLAEDLGINVGQTYRNDKRAQDFIHFIAANQMETLKKDVLGSKFIAVISDGATDSSHKESEILYVRYASGGKVSTNFVGIKNVGKPDAVSIEGAVVALLNETFGDTWLNKLVATGTDGASVMTGKYHGVVKKLSDRIERPIFGVHCSAHKLELAYKDACGKVPFYTTVSTLMMNLYYFYRNSPLNRHNLKIAFQVYDRPAKMPSRVGGTRWIPHILRAIDTIIYGYGPIVTQLRQIHACGDKTEKNSKAKNFLKILLQKDTVYFLHFLYDAVKVLSTISLKFQDRSTTIADIHQELECGKAVLQSYRLRDGPKLSSVLEVDLHDELSGSINNFPSKRGKIIDQLISRIEGRFDAGSDILRATSIVKLSTWPMTKKQLDDDPDFGSDAVKKLIGDEVLGQHLAAASVDIEALPSEWVRFKCLVYTRYDNVPTLSWDRLSSLRDQCQGVLDLMDCLLTIPASSAEAERGFSAMKMVKSDWRTRLSDSHLSELLTIQLESPEDDWEPDSSIHMWLSQSKGRRPYYYEDKTPVAKSEMPEDVAADDPVPALQENINVVLPNNATQEEFVGQCIDEGIEDYYSDFEEDSEELSLQEKRAYALFQGHLISSDKIV